MPYLLALMPSLPARLPSSLSMTVTSMFQAPTGSTALILPQLFWVPLAFPWALPLLALGIFYSLDPSNMCHTCVRFVCHTFIKDLLCPRKYARETLNSESSPDLGGREYVCSAYEKHTPVFTAQAHTPETQGDAQTTSVCSSDSQSQEVNH